MLENSIARLGLSGVIAAISLPACAAQPDEAVGTAEAKQTMASLNHWVYPDAPYVPYFDGESACGLDARTLLQVVD